MSKNVDFETSTELKRLFSQELDAWCVRHRLGVEELSARCGVSRSYLAHIGRYGRIPSKPVLILLALNFEMRDPLALFRAARVSEPWPFDAAAAISTAQPAKDGFLSIKLDMEGFVDAIKGVVREQLRPRSLKDLIGDRPLRIGLSTTQPWMYGTRADGSLDIEKGLIPEFIALLESALQCQISSIQVPFTKHVEKLRTGEIDLFGPMLTVPYGPSKTLFSVPINRVGVSAILRLRADSGLEEMPQPTSFEDLRDPRYRIAVMKDSRAQLLANTRLNRPNESLILCDSVHEATDRIRMRGVSNPAHIFICNTMNAILWAREHPDEIKTLFETPSTMIDIGDNSFAIRPDWPEAVPIINEAISFIMNSAGFARRSHEVSQRCAPGIFQSTQRDTSQLQGMMGMVG